MSKILNNLEDFCENCPYMQNNRKYDIKIVTRGRCMMCGKDLTEGLFFCKECEEKVIKETNK